MNAIYKELNKLRFKHNVITKEYCSKEDDEKYKEMLKQNQQLPEGFEKDITGVFKYADVKIEHQDEMAYLAYLQTRSLQSIKFWVVFWSILTLILMAFGLVEINF